MQISVSCVRLRVRNSYLVQITQQMVQRKQHIQLQFLKMSVRSVSLAVMMDGRTLWFKADSEERRPEMLMLMP